MDAIETLMNEHRTIERVLDALVGFADETRRKGTTEREELGRFVRFLREFADAFHHGKEEGILFEAMVAHGFPRQGGPIAVMLHEHTQGRAFIARLAALADPGAPWGTAELHDLGASAEGYANLLNAHIHKEDAVLYPMAEQHLPPEALQQVNGACESYEARQETGAAALVELAESLVARHSHAVRAQEPHAPPRFGCCG